MLIWAYKYLLTLEKAGGWKGVHKICMSRGGKRAPFSLGICGSEWVCNDQRWHWSGLVTEVPHGSLRRSLQWLSAPFHGLHGSGWSSSPHLLFWLPPVHLVSFSFFRFHLKCFFVTEAYFDNFVVSVPLPPSFSLCKCLFSTRDNRLVPISELSKYHFSSFSHIVI